LPAVQPGQRLDGRFAPIAKQTRPPPRHSEASLLSAMETAGRSIEDEALRAAMKDTGLGTPATRAATIETLIKRGFIVRAGKNVEATATGVALIQALPVQSLASPELTGSWEARLARIARGADDRTSFMKDIARYVTEVVAAIRGAPVSAVMARTSGPPTPPPSRPPGARAPAGPAKPRSQSGPAKPRAPSRPRVRAPGAVAPAAAAVAGPPPPLACPRCRQGTVLAGKRGWGCSRWRDGCTFVVWFEAGGKRLTDGQLRELVEKGRTRKARWPGAAGQVAGRLVLDLGADRDRGAARLELDP
jgi:DNA topoisomerase-3